MDVGMIGIGTEDFERDSSAFSEPFVKPVLKQHSGGVCDLI